MVITGRPRAHSASSLKFNQVSVAGASEVGSGSKLSYSSPELRSMLVGLETTVPQNLNRQDLASRHKPHRVKRRRMGSRASLAAGASNTTAVTTTTTTTTMQQGCCRRCCCSCCDDDDGGGGGAGGCGRCCHVRIFLVLMQMVVGAGVTALSVYLYLFLPVFPLRETPFWAGAPLCAAGIMGIYFCATNFREYSKTRKAFVLKVLCSLLSGLALIVCITAAIFIAIHLGRILTYVSCRPSEDGCRCFLSHDGPLPRIITYRGLPTCSAVFCEVKIYLIVTGSLCLTGSLFSFWFLVLLWKARYGRFYSGVRLPSLHTRDSSSDY